MVVAEVVVAAVVGVEVVVVVDAAGVVTAFVVVAVEFEVVVVAVSVGSGAVSSEAERGRAGVAGVVGLSARRAMLPEEGVGRLATLSLCPGDPIILMRLSTGVLEVRERSRLKVDWRGDFLCLGEGSATMSEGSNGSSLLTTWRVTWLGDNSP